ncbi:MAG TPA: hypothetical protein VGP04_15780 [Pseudonocardiaceae bacterium]|nr:hypothetical protein [Pseudonocardiaceae bacterium]
MDEPDSNQILTIEELRSLRDRMGAEAAAPPPTASAAQFEISDSPAGVPLEAPPDPWEALRRRARGQRRWAEFRWARPLAAASCLAAAGGGVALLVFTGHSRSDPPPTVEVFTPTTRAPSVTTSAPVSVSSTAEPSIVLPVPIAPAPSPSADGTTEPPTAAVPPPRATYRFNSPTSAKPPATRPSPARVPEPGPPPGAAADRAGTPGAATEPQPTVTRTPTSWSPAAPG